MEGLRVKSLEESIPILEQFYGIPAHLLKTHKFEEGTRNRIILATERKAAELENLARDTVKSASQRIVSKGYNPELMLFGPEKQLIQQAATSAPAASGRKITLPSGKVVVVGQ